MSLSEIRVNTTKTRTGVGTITYTETGPVITGIATASNFKTGSTNVHSTGVELTNINTGGATATFGGAISGTSATLSGALSGTTASFSGNVSIGGTLTYEDVTNIDAVGLVTARAGVHIPDNQRLLLGTNNNGELWSSGSHVYLRAMTTGQTLRLTGDDVVIRNRPDGQTMARFDADGAVDLYYNTSPKFATTNTGVSITGIPVATQNTGNVGLELHATGSGKGSQTKYHNDHGEAYVGTAGDTTGNLLIHNTSNTNILLATNNTERIRFTSTGQFHMGGGSGWTYASQKFVVVEPSNALGMLLQGNNANQGVNLTLQNINNGASAYSDLSFADDGGQIFGAIRGKVVDRDNNHGELQFHTSPGSLGEKLRIDKDGRVLLGTQKTYSELTYYDDLTINNSNNASGSAGGAGITLIAGDSTWAAINFGRSGDHDEGFVKYDNFGNYMIFGTGTGTERLRITSDGYLKHTGVRSGNSENKLAILTAPSYNTSEEDVILYQVENESGFNQLSIGGGTGSLNAMTALSFRTASAVNTLGGEERLRITPEGYLYVKDNGVTQTNTTLSYQSEGAFLTHYTARTTSGGDKYRRMFDIASVGANPWGSSIRFLTSADSTNPATTVERVRIDHNGRVGINKTTPQTMLSIKAERSAVPRFGIDGHYSDSSYTQCTWDDSGGLYTVLGINHKLDANGNDATPISSLHSASIFLNGRHGDIRFFVKPDSGTSYTEVMRMIDNGSVGINEGSPSNLLEISSNGSSKGLVVSKGGTNAVEIIHNGTGNEGLIYLKDGGSLKTMLYAGNDVPSFFNGWGLVVGHTASVDVASTAFAKFQVHNNNSIINTGLAAYGNNAGGCVLALGHSRSGTIGSPGTAVVNNDHLGDIRFAGDDGTDLENTACAIIGIVDGAVSGNAVPGRFEFWQHDGNTNNQTILMAKGGSLHIQREHLQIQRAGNNTSGFTKGGLVLQTPAYSEYHYTWSGQSSKTIDITCASYFHCEFIYVQHQTNGGVYMQYYARGKFANNHTTHTGVMWEWHGDGGGLDVQFTVSDQSGNGAVNMRNNFSNNGATGTGYVNGGGEGQNTGSANGRLRISETYHWGSVSGRSLIIKQYYGSHSASIS